MKKGLIVFYFVVLAMAPSLADDSNLMTSPRPTDLMPFPNPKKLYAGVRYYWFLGKQENRASLLGEVDEERNHETRFDGKGIDVEATYAHDDYWGLGFNIKHLTHKSTLSSPIGAFERQTYKNVGVSDPILSLIYRGMDMSRSTYDMNIIFRLSPKIQSIKGASESKKGNNGKGRTDLELALQFGKRYGRLSWFTGLDLKHFGESKESTDGISERGDSHQSLAFKVGSQWALSPTVSVDTGLSYQHTGEFEIRKEDGPTNSATRHYGDNQQVRVELGINVTLPSKNLFLVFDVARVQGGKQDIDHGNGLVSHQEKYSQTVLDIGLVWSQF